MTRQVTHLPPVWDILLPLAQVPDRRDRRLFSVSSDRHWQSGVKEIAKVYKRRKWDSKLRPIDCQSLTLTTEPPHPTLVSNTNNDMLVGVAHVHHCLEERGIFVKS